jgi:hypothetical protein
MMSRRRWLGHALMCLLLFALVAGLVASHVFSGAPAPAPAPPAVPVAELGIGELEFGPDFGRPALPPPQRGPVATAVLYGLLLLCPAKFVLLWVLQRREARHMDVPAGAPAPSDT